MESFDPYLQWLDIRPEERPVDHYRLLGIPRFESDAAVISEAADQRMAHVRQFQTGPRGRHTQQLLNELAAAKLCLLDAEAKQRYDQRLLEPAEPTSPGPPADGRLADGPTAGGPLASQDAPSGETGGGAMGGAGPAGVPVGMAVPPPSAPPSVVPPPVPPPRATTQAPPVGHSRPASESGGPGWNEPASPGLAGHSLRRTPASLAARRRRQASQLGCLVILGALAAGLCGFAFLVILSRNNSTNSLGGAENARSAESSPTSDPPSRAADSSAAGPSGEGPIDEQSQVVRQASDGTLVLDATRAELQGEAIRLNSDASPAAIVDWTSPEASVLWQFHLAKPGAFELSIRYAIDQDAEGGRYALLIDGRRVKVGTLRGGSTAGSEVVDQYIVGITRSGPHRLELRPVDLPGRELMRLFEVRLVPVSGGRPAP